MDLVKNIIVSGVRIPIQCWAHEKHFEVNWSYAPFRCNSILVRQILFSKEEAMDLQEDYNYGRLRA